MDLCAFYAVLGLLLEVAVAFGPVPRITWEHRGKKRNLSNVIWDILPQAQGFCGIWNSLRLSVLPASWSGVAAFAQLMKYLGPQYSKVTQALG